MDDGSKRFVLRGGGHNGMTVRLWPHNDGWDFLQLGGDTYLSPSEQDAKKPFLLHQP